jgi:hypothetical protein
MKRVVWGLILVTVATAAEAAVRFQFRQTSRSDFQGAPPSDITATAIVDGTRSRIEFPTGGPGYARGSYMIADQFTGNVSLVDPEKRTFRSMNLGNQLSSAARSGITISNLRSTAKDLPDQPVIAGIPTRHSRIEIQYDITVVIASIPLKQSVTTVIEEWSTEAFGDIRGALQASSSLRTGNPQLDEMLQAETSKLRGLPMRQIVTITTRSEARRNANSELKVNPTKMQISELLVASVETIPSSEAHFIVPPTFHRVEETADGAPR